MSFPDGRSLIVASGVKKFKINGLKDSKDGYKIANVEYLKESDIDPVDSNDLNSLKEYFVKVFGSNISGIKEKYGSVPEGIPFVYFLLDFLPFPLKVKQSFLELSTNHETIIALKYALNF